MHPMLDRRASENRNPVANIKLAGNRSIAGSGNARQNFNRVHLPNSPWT